MIEGKTARGSSEREREQSEFQSRKGISEIEGKAAKVAAKEREPRRNRWLRRDAARIAQRLPQLLDEVVVVFARADPKPDDDIAVFLRNSAIVISDSY